MILEEKIKQLEKELAELKAECDRDYEIEYTPGETYHIDGYEIDTGYYIGNSERLNKHGRCRHTKEGAESALKLQQEMMRLHALVEDLGGLKKYVSGVCNYFVYKSGKKWYTDCVRTSRHPGMVYMDEACANQVCDLLERGKYKLEV